MTERYKSLSDPAALGMVMALGHPVPQILAPRGQELLLRDAGWPGE